MFGSLTVKKKWLVMKIAFSKVKQVTRTNRGVGASIRQLESILRVFEMGESIALFTIPDFPLKIQRTLQKSVN
jgi:hypothetical protein